MASISNIPTNARSMNGIIILSDGVCNIEDGNITTDGDIITSNITTNDINLNLPGGRSLSVFDDLNNEAYYTDIITLSGVVYNNKILYYLMKILFIIMHIVYHLQCIVIIFHLITM